MHTTCGTRAPSCGSWGILITNRLGWDDTMVYKRFDGGEKNIYSKRLDQTCLCEWQ